MSESAPQEAGLQLDFVIPFDGTQLKVEKGEQEQVSERFKNMLDNCFLSHASSTESFEHPFSKGDISEVNEQLFLTKPKDPSDEMKRRYELIILTSAITKEDVGPERVTEHYSVSISISEFREDESAPESPIATPYLAVVYQFNTEDGLVRRKNPEYFEESFAEPMEPIDDGPVELGALFVESEEVKAKNRESAENRALARNMGVDEQPIGLQEMIALENFMQQPGWRPTFA